MAQVGVLSMAQLQIHDHWDWNVGGPILTVVRADSANEQMPNAVQRTTAPGVGAWEVLKRIVVRQDSTGTMRVLFRMTRGGGAGTVHGQARIYRAGALVWSGVDNSTAAGPTTYTDLVIAWDLLAQDCIEIWGYVSIGAAAVCIVDTMSVRYDATITEISRVPVTVPVAVTGPGILYTNAF